VLVYASNEDDDVHEKARTLIAKVAAGPDLLYIFWPVVIGYLRLMSHPGVLRRPWAVLDAASNIDELIARPHVRVLGERDGFWSIMRATIDPGDRGRAVPDAHIAALMRQNGVRTIYTRDRGFRRFTGIEVIDPFA